MSAGAMDRRLAGALDLLDEVGVADPTLGVTVASAAATAGIARSQVYRRWETVAEMNGDLAIVATCLRPGWQRRILELPPEGPIAGAIVLAAGGVATEIGVAVRAVAAGWPSTSAPKQVIADWELRWLHAFGRWLVRHLAAEDRRFNDAISPFTGAVAVASIVEGWASARTLDVAGDAPAPPIEQLGIRVERLLAQLTVPGGVGTGDAAARGDDVIEAPEMPAPRMELASRIVDTWSLAGGETLWSNEPTRLVDIERLARRIEVSSRSLYDLWPSVTSMNEALLVGWFDRERAAISEQATAWVDDSGTDHDFVTPMERFTDTLDASIRRRMASAEANQFSFSRAAADPTVGAVLHQIHVELGASLRTVYLAMLSMSGWYRRPGVSADEYARTNHEGGLGLDRIIGLHPELIDEALTFGGRDHPFCGTVLHQMGLSITTPHRPERS